MHPLAPTPRRAHRHTVVSTRRALRCAIAAALVLSLWLATAAPLPAQTPPALTLASAYHPYVDVQQYWVSEKYDGIRAHWTGQQLLSRQGLPIDAPHWFTHGWPAQAMDGELWAGRGQFATVQSSVAQGRRGEASWRQLRYMVFDLPQQPGDFSARQQVLQATVQALHQPWVQAAAQWQVRDHATLMRQLRHMARDGGEGLMLRRASSPYRGGRSDDLLKLKLHDDAEAVVIAHLPGRGKYRGMTGALLVQMPSGQRFKLGSGLRDAERAAPPPVGSTVTYRYQGLHPSGLPRFARYWRVRSDMHPPAASADTPLAPSIAP